VTQPTVQPVYGTYTTLTKTLVSLASSASFVAGQELPAIATGTYGNIEVSGQIQVGTTPTINTFILVYAFASLTDAIAWPDVFGGTNAAKTLTSVGVGAGFLVQIAAMQVDAVTSNRNYFFTATGLRARFADEIPKNIGLWVTHNTGVALNATESNHVIQWRGYNDAIPTV
jgi:hypothetical protein